ncbi:MAG TPA: hypothetical protein VID27_16025 [Blastocatellia bacterium]|jgi:hypothetical protein
MANINTDTKLREHAEPKNLASSELKREACIQLLNQWLADESGYDEENWPKIKAMVEENRTSDRSLFNE